MTNLIVNGGLSIASSGTVAPGADADTLLPAGSTAIEGWTVIGGPDTDDQLYWFGSGFNGLTSPDADAVALTGNINIEPEFGLEQTIATTPGMTFALTFDIGTSVDFPDPPPAGAAVSVTTGNQTTLVTGIITNGTDVWTSEEVDFTATSASTVIIIQGDAPGAYIGLDDIAVNTTTNPAPPVNLVTDGSFNQATAPATLPGTSDAPYQGSNLTSGSTAIAGWTVTANGAVGWIANDSQTPDASPSGVYALNLADNRALASGNQGGAPYGGVTQTIATTPGTTYQLTFELGNDNTTANTGLLPTGSGIAEPSGSAAMPGWTVIGGTASGNDGLAWLSNANPYGPTAETGSTFVSLAGYRDNSPYFGVAQTVATTAGQSYALTFWLGVDNSNANYTGPIGVSVTAGPVTQTIDNVSPTGSGNQWVEETVDFTASAASSVISIQGVQGDQYIGLDNVSVVQTGNGATGTNLITNGDFAEPSINPVGVSVTAGPVTTTFNNVDPTVPGSAWTPETVDFTATSTTSTIAIQGDQGQDYIGLANVAVTVATPPAPVTGATFSEDGTIDTFTVPTSGTYVIDAVGATGGGLGPGYAGGAGAEVEGTFALTAGDVIQVLVGEAGYGGNGGAGSGGGGSFVFDATTDTLLEAAGGGGGASAGSGGSGSAGGPGSPGQAGTSGTAGANYVNGAGTSFGGAGGTDGSGGAAGSFVGSTPGSDSGGGGGGFSGSGGNGAFGDGGASFLSGGAGGTGASLDTQHNGGFGGGGGANSDSVGAGGGGGFSGGGGGEFDIGGGGGSFIAPAATNVALTGGENPNGNGSVTINLAAVLGPDVFTDQAAATSGPYSGQYAWSDPANWSQGLPANGDSVEIDGTGVDDLPAFSASTLTLTATQTSVVGASLSATTIVASPGAELVADAALAGAAVAVTVGAISGTGGSYGAAGTGGRFVDNGASDPGSSSYVAALGGLVELAAPPAASSTLDFNTGGGTIALQDPAASNAVKIENLAAGDTLELPGSSVQSVVGLGTPDVTVTTSAGTYAFTDVTYSGTPVDGYTPSHDGVTGLEAITFVAPDVFTDQVAATSGPYSGFYLWSNAANWSQGLPVNGDNVVVEGSGADDLASLTLGTLTLAPSQTSVVGGALSAVAVTASSGGILEADAALANAPVAVTVGAINGTGGSYSAAGAGGGFVDNSASDPGSSSYVAALGGLVELAAPPAATSTLDFNSGGGTIALEDPAASNAVAILELTAGDTLELPGSSVTSVTGIGTASLTVTTSAGTYVFSNVAYDTSATPTGYIPSHDSATGLEAITFNGLDVFSEQAKATSGPYSGDFLWSNAANWSAGVPPVNGDNVSTANNSVGYDDLAGLNLSQLALGSSSSAEVDVVGGSLTVATLTTGQGGLLLADAESAGAPVTVTVGTIASTVGAYLATGTGATFVDNSATDQPGSTYEVSDNGLLKLAATPLASSLLDFQGGGGTLALEDPAASNAVAIENLAVGDTLELPGSSVTSVTGIGTSSLTVTTSAATYVFSNVGYDTSATPTGYTPSHDSTTGLEAITFNGPDVFSEQAKATSGPYSGDFLWSSAANWSAGVPPVNGSNVSTANNSVGYDDLAALSLSQLSLGANASAEVDVVGGSLTVATVVITGAGGLLLADAESAGAPVTVTVGTIASTSGAYLATGAGATFVDNSATDQPGSTYEVSDRGLLELAAPPLASSLLDFQGGGGTLALEDPAASNAVEIENLGVGDTLELPGSSVTSVTGIGTSSLTVTTSAGTYVFSNVGYDTSATPTGYIASHDSTTGLEAITFNGPDVFSEQAKATSGPYSGDYLWSNAANWSAGVPPVNGDNVGTANNSVGYDDLATLSLSQLALGSSSSAEVDVVGASLTVATVTTGQGGLLLADAESAGAPVTVTVGTIASTLGAYLATGTGATFVDNSATDQPGSTYEVSDNGLLKLAATPLASSLLDFQGGGGTLALEDPAASNAVAIENLGVGDTLELPGSSVTSVTGIGASSLTVTTGAGAYVFSNVAYDTSATPTGYIPSHDSATGLEAITFNGLDVFSEQAKATSGPYSGDFLWSNAANWSAGVPPVNGNNVSTANNSVGYDDLAGLNLSQLALGSSSSAEVDVVGASLTVATLTTGAGGLLLADAESAGAPVTVTVGTIASTVGAYLATGTGATFVDNSATDQPGSTYEVSDNGLLKLAATPLASSLLDFQGGGGTLALEDPAASNAVAIENLAVGDTLELPGSSVTSVTGIGTSSLTVTTSAGAYVFSNVAYDTSATPTGYIPSHDSATGLEAITFVACFGRGTLILTDRGERPVETLVVGELVRTVLSDVLAPIIWVGQRDIDCTRHPKPQQVWPVRVAPGAFGAGRPHSELFLSPNHAVYLNDVLIPIRHLLNGSTITQVPTDHVSYYHIELPSHDVVLAQGLPAESFLDLRDGSNYANRPGPVRLYPDFSAHMWEAFGCARLVVTGPELVAARALISESAGGGRRHSLVQRDCSSPPHSRSARCLAEAAVRERRRRSPA